MRKSRIQLKGIRFLQTQD